MTYSPELERGYRRLLACYPRAFRRENTDEIVGVLLASAAEGQRRPGLAESADLIRGAARMRLRPASRPPRAVLGAVLLMCAGAAASLAAQITMVVTTGSIHSAVLHQYPAFTAAQWHGVLSELAIKEIGALVCIGVWLWLAWANSRAHDWARMVFGAFYGLICLSLLAALSQGAPVYAPADFAVGMVEWLTATAALVLIYCRPASPYYRPEPARQ
jgi:hypothetical protein